MKLLDARRLLAAIIQLQQTDVIRKPKFAYFLMKNKRVLDQIEKDFVEALRDDEAQRSIELWDNDRRELLRRLAKKDETGEPMIKNNVYLFDNEAAAMIELQNLLSGKHPLVQPIIEEQNRKIAELNDKDEDIPLTVLPVSDWPDLPASLDVDALDALYLLMSD